MEKPITIFVSYAHEDDAFKKQLKKCLKPEIRKGEISIWSDEDIVAGQTWDEEIKNRLDQADVVIFLVSFDFIASDYIYDNEISRVIAKKKQKIIQIRIRPVDSLPLEQVQGIPPGDRAVSEWLEPDRAWIDVKCHLKTVFEEIRNQKKPLNASNDGSSNDITVGSRERNISYYVSWFPIVIMAIAIFAFMILFTAFLSNTQQLIFLFSSIFFLGASFGIFLFSKRYSLLPSINK